jgi:hypothetical protein
MKLPRLGEVCVENLPGKGSTGQTQCTTSSKRALPAFKMSYAANFKQDGRLVIGKPYSPYLTLQHPDDVGFILCQRRISPDILRKLAVIVGWRFSLSW